MKKLKERLIKHLANWRIVMKLKPREMVGQETIESVVLEKLSQLG